MMTFGDVGSWNCTGCNFSGNMNCFHPNTLVKKSNGIEVRVDQLKKGDVILTKDDMKICPTMVTNATSIEGSFDGLKLYLEDGKTITVTPPHLMLINKDGAMYPAQAKDVQVHDIVPLEDGKLSKIIDIQDVNLTTKVNIETAAGTLFANGIFVTGMCENSPSLEEKKCHGHHHGIPINSYADCLITEKI